MCNNDLFLFYLLANFHSLQRYSKKKIYVLRLKLIEIFFILPSKKEFCIDQKTTFLYYFSPLFYIEWHFFVALYSAKFLNKPLTRSRVFFKVVRHRARVCVCTPLKNETDAVLGSTLSASGNNDNDSVC